MVRRVGSRGKAHLCLEGDGWRRVHRWSLRSGTWEAWGKNPGSLSLASGPSPPGLQSSLPTSPLPAPVLTCQAGYLMLLLLGCAQPAAHSLRPSLGMLHAWPLSFRLPLWGVSSVSLLPWAVSRELFAGRGCVWWICLPPHRAATQQVAGAADTWAVQVGTCCLWLPWPSYQWSETQTCSGPHGKWVVVPESKGSAGKC